MFLIIYILDYIEDFNKVGNKGCFLDFEENLDVFNLDLHLVIIIKVCIRDNEQTKKDYDKIQNIISFMWVNVIKDEEEVDT